MLVNGGHGFKVLKDIEMIEVKQGPYSLSTDKTKFNVLFTESIFDNLGLNILRSSLIFYMYLIYLIFK